MGGSSLYDADVYAWSEQQTAALRRLAARHDLPNDLDLVHIAEEIEDVGVSQLHAVRSLVRLILVHAIKCWADPAAPSVRHWAAEIGNWRDSLVDRLTAAMRAKVDMGVLWRRAVRQSDLDLAEHEHEAARARVRDALNDTDCPISLDDLCGETMGAEALAALIQAAVIQRAGIDPG
jgi:hypothetical protein